MTLAISDLGVFEGYRPDPLPPGAPTRAQFCRRAGDGVDWYTLIHGDAPALPPTEGVIYATARSQDGRLVIAAASEDPTMLFPRDGHLLTIRGLDTFSGVDGLSNITGWSWVEGASALSPPAE